MEARNQKGLYRIANTKSVRLQIYLWMREEVWISVLMIITLRHMWWSFYVQWDKMRADCSFYLYWWHCWPSLFKSSFHEYIWTVIINNNWLPLILIIYTFVCKFFSHFNHVETSFSDWETPLFPDKSMVPR